MICVHKSTYAVNLAYWLGNGHALTSWHGPQIAMTIRYADGQLENLYFNLTFKLSWWFDMWEANLALNSVTSQPIMLTLQSTGSNRCVGNRWGIRIVMTGWHDIKIIMSTWQYWTTRWYNMSWQVSSLSFITAYVCVQTSMNHSSNKIF